MELKTKLIEIRCFSDFISLSYLIPVFLWFGVAGITLQHIEAQSPALRKYESGDGLPGSNVYFTFQDSKGFVWVGTEKGLAKFNGYEFSVITSKDGLPSNDIFGLVEDKEGRLWVNTFNEAVYIYEGKVMRLEYPAFKGEIVFHQIDPKGNHIIDAAHKLYICRKNEEIQPLKGGYLSRLGSYYLLPDAVKELEFPPSRMVEGNFIYFDGDYFEPHNEYFKLNTQREVKYFPKMGIFSFDQKLFVAESSRIVILENGQETIIEMASIFGEKGSFIGFNKINDQLFYFLSTNGIRVFDDNLIEQTDFDFLNDLKLNSINLDRDGNLWISTKHGLYFLGAAASSSKTIKLSSEEADNSISSICYNEGKLWMGSDGGNLFLYQNEATKKYILPGMQGDKIRSILATDGKLFLGGSRFYMVDEALFLPPTKPAERSTSRNAIETQTLEEWDNVKGIRTVKAMNFTKEKKILIAKSSSADLISIEKERKMLSNTRSYAIVEDLEGKIWIGHKDGLEVFEHDSLINLRSEHPYFSTGINHLAVDKENYLWIATDGFGVLCYKDSFLMDLPSLKEKIVNKIHITEENVICFAFNKGMEFYTIESYVPFRYQRKRISAAHGLCSDEVTGITSNATEIIVATTEGVTIFQKDEIQKSFEVPKVYFENITINENTLPANRTYDLKYNENNIDISFLCLSYKSNQEIDYQYKMDGIDEQWHWTRNRFKEYTTLPPGNYSFRLKAKDVDDMITEEAVIVFNIHPPFWGTTWFRIIALLLGIGGVIRFVNWRTAVIRRQSEEQNLINQQIAESELRAFKAQMNPHFVFNALNAIQDFIFQNDPLVANEYLSKFSKLMRLFLESARERFIPLSDELNILSIYTELEQLRFKDKFKYEIIVDEEIIPENLEIPSMFLQPFVENAVNHGLAYRKSMGKLKISFVKKDAFLHCLIEDNGIGRAKANQIKNKSTVGYKSRGMQLIEERRKTLSVLENININIQVIDLEDDDGSSGGTRVEIIMPLM